MYLEKIEMSGFKSFADKITIDFDRGMTAVVGPNGSGKSNLSEAIRWVLGEQSAKSLRGNKMEDVIFNGSQDRKPVNIAKVTITLNNEDHYLDFDRSQVTIARHYHRNGESQYYINNEAVRLKDVTDLLLDTGIGKNSFAMISQGKVESIFLSKPEERRGIFEEAAGVQKYQVRKVEAQRKMTRSQDHLSRVKDILHELDLQLTPLKEQSEKAKIYQEKTAILKENEIAFYTYQIDKHRQDWLKTKDKFDAASQTLNETKAQQSADLEALDQAQIKMDEISLSLDQGVLNHQELERTYERHKADLLVLDQQIHFADQTSEDKEVQRLLDQEKLSQVQEEIEVLLTQKTAVQANIKDLQSQLEKLQGQMDDLKDLDPQELEALRNQLFDAYRQESQASNQVNHYQETLEQYQSRRQRFDSQLAELEAEAKQIHAELNQEEASLGKLKEQVALHESQSQAIKAELDQLNQERNSSGEEGYRVHRQAEDLRAKWTTLKSMQAEYSGYYQGVRAVMSQAHRLSGIIGPVADLIQVEDEYRLAIEMALGGALQNVVVEDDQAARTAINYLKQERAGRATFLPRSHVKARYLRDQQEQMALEHANFVGLAGELVTCHHDNREVVLNLLGSTIVMSTIESAQEVAKALNHQAKIVTLTGEIIMPGGAITGGRDKQNHQSVLGRQGEVQALEDQLKQALETEKTLTERLDRLNQSILEKQADWQKSHQVLEQDQVALKEQEGQIQARHQQANQIKVRIQFLQDDWQTVEDNFQTAHQELAKVQAEKVQALETIEAINTRITQQEMSQKDRQQEWQVLSETYNQVKTQLALEQMTQQQIKDKLADQEKVKNNLSQSLSLHSERKALDQAQLEELQAKKAQMEALIAEQDQAIQVSQADLDHLRQARQEANQAVKHYQEQSRQYEDKLSQYYQEVSRLESQVERLDELIDQELLYLSDNYQLSYEAASKEAKKIESQTATQALIKKLKQEIDRLGPINLAAIEDYELLKERYDIMSEQEADLLQAMKVLEDTIEEMDHEVATRFKESFDAINFQFQRSFVKLFGGGKAELLLTDPDNLLETGVDIEAQPPGKRKQNLALLSGGERALTAIALLFAILETKSVPFVVLDEVEAALDDANVYRYGEYIQNFTHNTQFIVITHRKGTMEYADVLYGVTMEQTGVSKLASVKLSDQTN